MHTLKLSIPVAIVLFSACSNRPKFDIDVYPGANVVPSGGNEEGVEGTLFKVKLMTPDGKKMVAEWYRGLMVAKGWKEDDRDPVLVFTDGNMRTSGTYDFNFKNTPLDPSQPGGLMAIYDVGNTTEVKILRYIPKK